jgi:hypothetical protein
MLQATLSASMACHARSFIAPLPFRSQPAAIHRPARRELPLVRRVFLTLWLLVFGLVNVSLLMSMAPGTPWDLLALNLAALVLLVLWYYGYFTLGRRRHRGLVIGAAVASALVGLLQVVHGLQAWHGDSCDAFHSSHRGLFQEWVRLMQSLDHCETLGAGVALLGALIIGASLHILRLQWALNRRPRPI